MSALQQVLRGKILILTVCAAGIGGTFQYGYNLTIINAPTAFIQSFINETWLYRTGAALEGKMITLVWSFIVAVYPLGGLVGALIAAPMAVKMGRKKSLLLNNAFVALASLLVGFSRVAKSFEMILLSRFFAGINSGVAMSIQPMYLGESAPKELRGAVAMTSASFAALGLVIGQVAGLREILGAEESWPVLLASNAVPGLVQLVLLPWAPESPRYLLIDRGDQDSCISALRQLRGSSDLSIEMKEILAEQAALQGQATKAPWELWSNRAVRWQLITVVVLSSAMQLCGNDSMYFYASYVFQEAGIPYDKIQYSVIGTGSCELIMSMTCALSGFQPGVCDQPKMLWHQVQNPIPEMKQVTLQTAQHPFRSRHRSWPTTWGNVKNLTSKAQEVLRQQEKEPTPENLCAAIFVVLTANSLVILCLSFLLNCCVGAEALPLIL
ncbi:solute carrier family 2, facilitated glucose transporter member 11 isoform X2 [Crotalus tigris]|uniref:solute carrier family 2, facilitated glucose transporter member 11 isoform X2 n=1 Tax=Crotalus tigris TaxID=88082 RepID=UPI00192F5080|nr:solute carrier family 2, facilitated glucose transporter member 11 isoform X2 [Crotalus tigris]